MTWLIYNGYEVRIENSVTRVASQHQERHADRIFVVHLTTKKRLL